MATRSHPLMPRGHSYWGVFANATQFPNVSGAPIQSAKVRVGDLAYEVATSSLCVCTTQTAGAAVWVSFRTDNSPTIFRPTSAGDFALLSRDAGTTMTLAVGTMANEPFYDQITLTSFGGSAGMTWWETSVPIPSTGRFRIMGKLGPRATASPGISPQVGFAVQHVDRAAWIQRNNVTTQLINTAIRNGGVAESNATGGDAIVGVGPNATPGGGDFFADVIVRQPSSGVDPSFEIVFCGYGIAAGGGANGACKRLNSLSTLYTGGSPPSLGWNAAWRSGGNLKICVGGYEYAGAGSSFIAGFRVQKHPLD